LAVLRQLLSSENYVRIVAFIIRAKLGLLTADASLLPVPRKGITPSPFRNRGDNHAHLRGQELTT